MKVCAAVAGAAITLGLALLLYPAAEQQHRGGAVPVTLDWGRLPLAFEANRGQADTRTRFLARTPGFTLELGDGRVDLALAKTTIGLRPVGSATAPPRLGTPRASRRLPGVVNRIGRAGEPSYTGVPTFAEVGYDEVWPGIGLRFHGRQGALEYDFHVAPGADPDDIALRLDEARSVKREHTSGDVIVTARSGEHVRLAAPVSYQDDRPVDSRFVVDRATKTVRVAVGAYDRRRPLVIDPVITYGTFLGAAAEETGEDVAVDDAGNVYVVGTQGASAIVWKLDAAGTAVQYETTIPSSGATTGTGIARNPDGTGTWVTGSTQDGLAVTAASAQPTFGGGGSDAYLARLDAMGALAFATYFGGSGDDSGAAIAVDTGNRPTITGRTASAGLASASAFQEVFGEGASDGFVTQLDQGGASWDYVSYLGGAAQDVGTDVAVDPTGATAVVVGHTGSADFPRVNAIDSTVTGIDAFVSSVNLGSTGAAYSTYLGGALDDRAMGVAMGPQGRAVVVGDTGSEDFPAPDDAVQPVAGGLGDAFVTRLSASGTLEASTYLGGADVDGASTVALAPTGSVHVAGATAASTARRHHSAAQRQAFPVTADAPQPLPGGTADGFVAELSPGLDTLVTSTYLGGPDVDFATGIAVTSAGDRVVAGTSSGPMPTTPGTVKPAHSSGSTDAFVFGYRDGVSATPSATATPPPSTPTPSASAEPTPQPTTAATAQPTAGPPPPSPTAAALPEPEQGKSFNLARVEGTVLVRLPGGRVVRVVSTTTIPPGAIVDARRGRATVYAANTRGDARGMQFSDGVFRITQPRRGDPTVTATLAEQLICPRRRSRAADGRTATAAASKKRRLWGSGKGRFRTVGRGSSAAVRGTRWLTEDTCTRTVVRVAEGTVEVTDKATGAVYVVRRGGRVAAPFSVATLRKIQRGGRRTGRLTAKARRKLRAAAASPSR